MALIVPPVGASRRRNTLWLTASVGLLLAVVAYSYLDGQAFRHAAAGAERSRLRIEEANEILSLITSVETGQRGFLLSGEPFYLVEYQAALPKVQRALERFRAMGAADSADWQRLPELVKARLDRMAGTIRMRQQGSISDAVEEVRTGRGKREMDDIREAVARIVAAEGINFRDYSDSAERHGYQTRLLAQAVALLLTGFIWLSGRRINRLALRQEELIENLTVTREREAKGRAALATTLRSIGDAVIATDEQGRVHFMNPVAEALTGWTMEAAEGQPLPEVFRIEEESTGQPAADIAAVVLRDGVTVGLANHTVLQSKAGERIPIDDSAAPIHDDQGKVTGVVLVFRDVTLRRRAQRRLEDSESRYRLLFESNPQPMWVFDNQTLAFLAVNQAAIACYGYSREEFLSMTLREIRPPEDVPHLEEQTRNPALALRTLGPLRHRTKAGVIFFVDVRSHPIQFGDSAGRLVMVTDVTERLRLEEDLRQSQKLEAVGQLAGGIAHDFNNLLTVIEGYGEMLQSEQQVDSPQRVPVQEILVAAQRASSLTRQLLAFSRRQILQPLRLNLNSSVNSTHRMLARLLGEQIRIQSRLERELWQVFADPGQIDQIILNLAVNARDAMERGGTLTLETANVGLRFAEKLGLPAGEYACLSVGDTGHGMDQDIQRRIFEPFFTTKELGRGTGLGLSTVYGIVKQSGGFITVVSDPGQGSTFCVYLPRVEAARAGEPQATPRAAAHKASGECILVVEDDANIRHLVAAMLKGAGYRISEAETPQDALRLLEDPSVACDMLLTDVVLPEIDGLEVAQRAVGLRPGLPVLFMSGYTEHPILRLPGFDRGAPFLQKPFTRDALLGKVSEVLESTDKRPPS
ncbi:MAG: PAS domain S-box protein [Candidatus Solibacter sp.]